MSKFSFSKYILTPGKKRLQQWRKRWVKVWRKRLLFFLVGMVLTGGGLLLGLNLYFSQRVLFGVVVAGVDASSLTESELRSTLAREVEMYKAFWPVYFRHKNYEWEVGYDANKIVFDIDKTVERAISYGKNGSYLDQITDALVLIKNNVDLPAEVRVDEEWLESLTASISAEIDVPHIPPSVALLTWPDRITNSRVQISLGEVGREFNQAAFKETFYDNLRGLDQMEEDLLVDELVVNISDEQVSETRKLAEAIIEKTLTLTFEHDGEETQVWEMTGDELIHFITVEDGISREKVRGYITEMAKVVDRVPEDAKFSFNNETNRVEEFAAAKSGFEVDVDENTERMKRALALLSGGGEVGPVYLQVSLSEPEVTLAEINELGIEELLGRGVSTYYGSIPSRVHNVDLAAARISGTLVKPGEEFSFNEAVGEVTKKTGFKEAYVIFEGRTELGDGGGVCQDSTTTFRAMLDAGLPVTQRKPHSYRVGYYEQDTKPGIDATVYPPYADLKFMNDTPAHLLIQAAADTPNRTLVVEIYGTSDGRVSEISNHTVWDISPPPPDVFVDDPTLPAGTVKQIEKPVGGAKAKFDYTVRRDGEVIVEETFYSFYKPWAAVFLRGVGG